MKKITTLVLILVAVAQAYGQKPVIDTSAYGIIRRATIACISDNGTYIYYQTYSKKGELVSIKGTHNAWAKEIGNVNGQILFANECQLLITKYGLDSLCLQILGSDHHEFIPHVVSFNVSQNDKAEWLIYQLNTSANGLVIRNLATGKQQSFSNVTSYQFSAGDRAVIIQQKVSDSSSTLGWLDLDKGILSSIWKGRSHGDLIFSADGKAMAFTGSSDSLRTNAIWYYKTGDEKAGTLLPGNSPDASTRGLSIGSLIGFYDNGNRLFFTLRAVSNKFRNSPNPNLAGVDIYGYKDTKLQSRQLLQLQNPPAEYTCVLDFLDHKLILLEKKNEHLLSNIDEQHKQDFVLINEDGGGDVHDEWNWNPAARSSIYLLSLKDGTRKCLCKDQPYPLSASYQLSPDSKYVVYYNALSRGYFSYNIASGVTRNITKDAGADWIDEDQEDVPDSAYAVNPNYRWAANDEAVFINSKNQIYQADPSGKLPAICLTSNYADTHHFQFRFADFLYAVSAPKEINLHEPLLLKVLNKDTRAEGYCKVMPGRENKPELLKMMPYHFDLLQKARDAEVYTVQMESTENSPDQFLTTDFKTFTPLTDNPPEKAYNWLTSELVHFKTPDGKAQQGILFKPKNFNAKKKYPVIFEYYERNIVGLHQFLTPGYSDGGRIDIPTYVSNGYLVFTPDIHYKVGYPGRSACNTILAATDYLSQFPWVDQKHIGLMGHSFGGFETNYVITHSHRFAAAVSMSGMTDFISAYGSIIGNGTSRQHQYELYRDRIGASLWQRPDLYLENSPVLKADQVTTPVLLMANKKDDDVPYEQGFEFFTALRRLQKKAWLLQYDEGGHQVFDETGKKDLTMRMQQFLDYYLKDKPAPKWMVSGVPANLKQVDSGFEPDTTGKLP